MEAAYGSVQSSCGITKTHQLDMKETGSSTCAAPHCARFWSMPDNHQRTGCSLLRYTIRRRCTWRRCAFSALYIVCTHQNTFDNHRAQTHFAECSPLLSVQVPPSSWLEALAVEATGWEAVVEAGTPEGPHSASNRSGNASSLCRLSVCTSIRSFAVLHCNLGTRQSRSGSSWSTSHSASGKPPLPPADGPCSSYNL